MRGRDLQRHDHDQFRRTFNATFSSSASGPVSGTAAIPGNTGLFTGETLASGTPTLPTLNVPYTATVLQQRQLAAGAASSPCPSATGGLLYGATVPMPTGYSVLSNYRFQPRHERVRDCGSAMQIIRRMALPRTRSESSANDSRSDK